MTRSWPLLVVLALVTSTVASTALAQRDLPLRRVGVRWTRGAPQVSFSARDLVTPRLRRELADGTRHRLAVTVQAYRAGSRRPLASRRMSCSVTYDVFARAYLVRMGRRSWVLSDAQEVLDRCLALVDFTVGSADVYRDLGGERVVFVARAEFNPISRARCRQLLRRSANDDNLIGPVVISILRREICAAERVVEFRSQPIVVPARARR